MAPRLTEEIEEMPKSPLYQNDARRISGSRYVQLSRLLATVGAEWSDAPEQPHGRHYVIRHNNTDVHFMSQQALVRWVKEQSLARR